MTSRLEGDVWGAGDRANWTERRGARYRVTVTCFVAPLRRSGILCADLDVFEEKGFTRGVKRKFVEKTGSTGMNAVKGRFSCIPLYMYS